MNLPAVIPDAARLPGTYQRAKTALAECVEIDECMEWADKAAALAAYAKMSEDTELEVEAKKIRGRAIRRCGELLKQIEKAQGMRTDLGGALPLSRKQVATDAGMSSDQAKTALRVANVPEREFERQIESPNPPSVTALAEQGVKRRTRQPVDLGGRTPEQFNRAMHFTGNVERALAELREHDAATTIPHLSDDERKTVREAVSHIAALCRQIEESLR